MREFFDMGGYAAFVWPAWGLTFIVVIMNIVWARRTLARSRQEAKRRLAIRGGQA
jgi:heme exporter protein CcmD